MYSNNGNANTNNDSKDDNTSTNNDEARWSSASPCTTRPSSW